MDFRFDTTSIKEGEHIYIELPNNITAIIARCDVGYAVDFETQMGEIIELAPVIDDDLEDAEVEE